MPAFSQTAEPPAEPGKQFILIDSIGISGNKITIDKVILREIVFTQGEYVMSDILDSLVRRSRENLMNTLLFNFVEINVKFKGPGNSEAAVLVRVTERWYIWPTPILKISDRNFNVWWQTEDFSRLSYGFYIDWKNFRGRKENLILKFQWGYNRILQVQYQVPYLNRKKTLGMTFGAGLSRQREAAYATMYNKQEFYKDPVTFAVQDVYAYGQFLVRRNIYNYHEIGLRYDEHHFSDSLLSYNYNYTIDSSDYLHYYTLSYSFKSDHRDYKSYPLNGYYIDFALFKYGLWNFSSNTVNIFKMTATFRKYWELDPRVYFASGLNGMYCAGYQPYYILGGIGYDRDIVRSYEYYLVDAQYFGIFKNNVKFALIPQREKDIKFIKSEKFGRAYYALYLDVFFDAGFGAYHQDYGRETNDLQNTLLLGYGAGLDFVTYYDVVVRLEYSINFKNEAGLFLHFRAPI
jgi:outer membrane protein assembly factor BamA